MATGKTNPRWMRLIVDAVDLSGDSRQMGAFGSEYDMTPVEGWSDGVKHFTFGQPSHIFNGYQAVMNNTAATGSHTELVAQEEYIISLAMGIRAAPTYADPAWIGTMEQHKYIVEGTDAVLVSMDTVKAQTDIDQERVWGEVVVPGVALTSTTSTTDVNSLASSSNGALAHLHVTVSDGGTWAFKIQDSPTGGGSWADLITFSANGSAITAETGTVAGTVDQYLQVVATRTSGTCTIWVTLARQ